MFDFLFNPQGRISRKGMWLGFLLPYIAISVVLGFLEGLVPALAALSVLVGLFYLWPNFATSIKRLHDHGRSGWWLLLYIVVQIAALVAALGALGKAAHDSDRLADLEAMGTMTPEEQGAVFAELIPLALGTPLGMISTAVMLITGIAFFVYLYVMPGQRMDNKYGRDPLAEGRGFAD